MKVTNMTSNKGNKIANQFIVFTPDATYFQSYNSIIVKTVNRGRDKREVYLDETYWNYSRTTSKYRSLFLGESTKETKRKIKAGLYQLADLQSELV